MNLIMMDGDKRHATFPYPDDLGIPPEIKRVYVCDLCGEPHEQIFFHYAMHDDGELYTPKESIEC